MAMFSQRTLSEHCLTKEESMSQATHTRSNLALNGLARDKFPVFQDHPNTIYFDSGATAQKPEVVMQVVTDYHKKAVNVGRGNYSWSAEAYEQVQKARQNIGHFIHANTPAEVVFTAGATAGFNTICSSWGLANLQQGDEILLCAVDHKSSTLPWISLKHLLQQFGIAIKIQFYGVDATGKIDIDDLVSKITERTRLVSLTHINNVYGNLNDIAAIRARVPSSVLFALDASQSIGHVNVDVQQLGVDFMAYSGHKMFASTGIGVLWIHEKLHSQLRPSVVGGGNGSSSLQQTSDDFSSTAMPDLLEAGTQNVAGILSLGAATEFVQSINIETIHAYLTDLTIYLLEQLRSVNHIEYVPATRFQNPEEAYGIVSMRFGGLSSSEVGSILEESNIFVRTGDHCMSRIGDSDDSLRVSLHIYNTKHEVDLLIKALKELLGTKQ
jgi:cysteine desulfurase / selenocysteine lyase